ncbi:RNA polymerase I-specific transcription initiation factor RRN3 [Testicularia cyperi]|uniref:RNA polymerase I-specific transcription initiation factor RRN3 n=1 Tax=Testicularia cyperi TaxID=1882483 RepID=A0A317XYL7_9BASI|nr:RNA polymerase I-specific transcription initiation factor RRN3 [Testicularia cyperi]
MPTAELLRPASASDRAVKHKMETLISRSSSSKRGSRTDHDAYHDYLPSPAKRRSPPSDGDTSDSPSSPLTPSQVIKPPLRSSLSKKPPPPGSMAALNSAGASANFSGMYLSFVINALAEKHNGNSGPYIELLVQFANPGNGKSAATVSSLRSLLAALSHVVSDLDRSHSKLVENIFALPWTSMDDSFAQMWIKFVCSLVSARSEWLSPILSKATKALSYRLEWLPYQFADDSERRSMATFKRKQVYERVHTLIRALLNVVPTLPSVLGPLLVQHLPHKGVHRSDQLVYVRNILHVSEYCAELSEVILGAVIDRAIQLDVEIQVELDDFDDEEAEELGLNFDDPFEQTIDELDESDDDSDDEGDFADNLSDLSDENYDQNGPSEQKLTQDDLERSMRHIKDSIAKLDGIMITLFQHLRKLDDQYLAGPSSIGFTGNSPMDAGTNRRNLFHTLLGVFARNILPTFRSRHVQFLLFWFNSLDPEFSDFFLGVLLEKSLYTRKSDFSDKEEPLVIRSAAAGYVASFVSRASYVDGPTTRIVLYNLCAFMDAHIDESSRPDTEAGMAAPGSNAHAVFYAVAQAAFYIFCFRWRDLKLSREEQDGGMDPDSTEVDEMAGGLHSSIGSLSQFASESWCDGLGTIQRAITSRLNPLKFCSANVVKQFARIAQHTGFLYCYSVIEANNRSMRRVRSAPVSRSTSVSRLHLDGASTPMSQDSSDRGTPRPGSSGDLRDEARPTQHQSSAVQVTTASVLEAFFPFDPYKLESSASFIVPLYREWSDVAPDEGDSSSEEEDDDDELRNNGLAGLDIPGAKGAAGSSDLDEDGEDDEDEDEANSSSFVSQVEAMSISPYLGA